MRLRSLRVNQHPGIGSCFFSFLDPNGVEYDTVIFAGGNGCGKTVILELIQKTLEGSPGHGNAIVELEIRVTPSEIERLSSAGSVPSNITDIVVIQLDMSKSVPWEATQIISVEDNGNIVKRPVNMGSANLLGVLPSFFNEAALNFNPGQISSSTSLTIDDGQKPTMRSGEALASQIAQLLVDVRSADAEELSTWVVNNPGAAVPDDLIEPRFRRFRRAFESMFPLKRFSRVDRRSGQLHIEFIEGNRVSTIQQLSSGEKQIVFRAGFLLRDLQSIKNSVVLFDEPELSLHPDWQERILSFYKNILTDASGECPQLFLATHSPFIVHGSANSKIIILERNKITNDVREASNPSYPTTAANVAVRAFSINSFLSAARRSLLLLTEGASDAEILYTAWEKLYPGIDLDVEIRPALGDKNIQITLNDAETFRRLRQRKIAGLFDFDTAYNQWNGVWKKSSTNVVIDETMGLTKKNSLESGWALLLPVPPARSSYASVGLAGKSIMSIEFLFSDTDIPSQMIDWQIAPMGGSVPKFKDSDKSNFASMVQTLPPASFINFVPIFDRVDDILNGRI